MNKRKDNDGDEEDEDIDDASEDMSSDEDDDDEKIDFTPIENDSILRELIEKRLQLDDKKASLFKEISDLERQFNILNNKLATIEKEVKRTEGELRDFQREKLQKINKLYVSHFVKLS